MKTVIILNVIPNQPITRDQFFDFAFKLLGGHDILKSKVQTNRQIRKG